MSGAKHRRGQLVHIELPRRDFVRSAIAFGRSGGCSAGCANCLYECLCRGGEIGADESEVRHEVTRRVTEGTG